MTHTERWHVPQEDLARYARQELGPPLLWSVEAHLSACGLCREGLTEATGPDLVDEGWARLDAELDAPRPGPVEGLLLRVGVADHTARLLAATPALRRSWLVAVVLTLVMTVAASNAMRQAAAPLLFLATAPLLPLAGVALSFGPRLDPTHEMALVAPLHTFRLLLLRAVAVLSTTTVCGVLASLLLPSFGLAALGWLLPALALTVLALALMPRLGTTAAPLVVGAGWIAVTVASATASSTSATPLPFTLAGQLAAAATAVAAAAVLLALRDRFDAAARLSPFNALTSRRPS